MVLATLLPGGFSLGKGTDTVRFWLGSERLESAPLALCIGGRSSCCLLRREFTATAGAQPCTASPAVGGPLLVRAAIELGPYSLGEKKTGTPTASSFPEGAFPRLRRSPAAAAQPSCFLPLPLSFSLHSNPALRVPPSPTAPAKAPEFSATFCSPPRGGARPCRPSRRSEVPAAAHSAIQPAAITA